MFSIFHLLQHSVFNTVMFACVLQKGHYLVLLCPSAIETARWVATLKTAGSFVVTYRNPSIITNPSLFRDIILIDFGTTSVRAGIMTNQRMLNSEHSKLLENNLNAILFSFGSALFWYFI